MLEVSEAWKETHKQRILPETFVEITMSNIDSNVEGTVVCNNEIEFSQSAILINNQRTQRQKYAFLEHNLWCLDGSMFVLDDTDSYNPMGYVSKNAEQTIITVNLTEQSTTIIPGFTIIWSDEYDTYARKFVLEVRNKGTTVSRIVVENNESNISIIDNPVSEYDSIVVTVLEWSLPNQRHRIDSILFGCVLIFGKNEIISYSHEQSGSPLGTELTKNTIAFELNNADGRWNILNPNGLSKYLCERQRLDVRYGLSVNGTVEWINSGIFYLSEWKVPSNALTINFVAQNVMSFFADDVYGRPYLLGVTTKETVCYFEIEDSLSDNPSLTQSYKANHKVTILEKALNSSYKELYHTDDNWWVYADCIKLISEDPRLPDGVLTADVATAVWNRLPKQKLSISSRLNKLPPVVVEEMNTAEFLQKCMVSYGLTMWHRIEDDVVVMAIPSTTLSDYRIPADTSYIRPEVNLANSLKKIGITHRYSYKPETETVWTDVHAEGGTLIVDCPYLWNYPNTIKSLSNDYASWWGHREIVSGEYRADPRLELFDVVTVETQYGDLAPVMITYLKYTYDGSFHAVYEGKVIGDFGIDE